MSAHRLWMKSGASGRAVNFYHSSVQNNGYDDRQNPHGNTDQQRFHG